MVQANDPFATDERAHIYRQLCCAKCGEPLPVNQDKTTLFCELCGQGHKSLAPPPSTKHAAYGAGDGVAVSWEDRWWPAHVLEMVGKDRYLVHYEGWGPKYDEVVDISRIRLLNFVPGSAIIPPKFDDKLKVKRANMFSAVGIVLVLLVGVVFLLNWAFRDQIFNQKKPAPSEIKAANFGAVSGHLPGLTLRPDFQIEQGQTFYVKWGHSWYLGTVVTVESQEQLLIQYDGWGDYQNELVTRDRLRVIP